VYNRLVAADIAGSTKAKLQSKCKATALRWMSRFNERVRRDEIYTADCNWRSFAKRPYPPWRTTIVREQQ
jgi:hypothetical protein